MRRTVLLGVLLALLMHLYRAGIPMTTIRRSAGPSALSENLAASTVSTGYLLPEKDASAWLRFPLPPGTRSVKVLTHAGLPTSARREPDSRYWYKFRCRIEAGDGVALASFGYHHYTGFTRYRDPRTGKETDPRFYLDSDVIPADGKMMRINFDNYPGIAADAGGHDKPGSQAAFILFQLDWKDPIIRDVLIRVYTEEKVTERKLGYLWRRLSPMGKAYLTSGNLYPPDFLTEKEKYHVLHHMWQPLGPLGVETIDYIKRDLYIFREVDGDPVREAPIPPAGLLVDRFHRGIIPLPPGGGKVRLDIRRMPDAAAPEKMQAGHLRLCWFGIRSTDHATRDVSWSGEDAVIEQVFEGGLIEIETDRNIVVRAFLIQDGAAQEITPDPVRIRAYLMGPDAPVIYDVAHRGQRETPFRLDLRRFTAPETDMGLTGVRTVRYALLDMTNAELKEGTISVAPEITRYDWFSGYFSGGLTSEPTTRYFSLGPEVARIRLTSDGPVVVSAYNRLPGMIKETRVPDDFYAYPLRDETRKPAWFSLRPAGHDRLLLSNRSPVLTVQHRPPEVKPALEAGQYKWEAFTPETAWEGRYLFVPRTPGESFREEQLTSVYRRLQANRDVPLMFHAMADGRRVIQPTLIFFRKDRGPAQATLYLNGRLFHRIRIAGGRGELTLPPLPTGRQIIRLDSPPGIRWHINHAGGAVDPHLKRFAKRIGPGAGHRRLEFSYEKSGPVEEVLMIHLFSPLGTKEATRLRVRVGAVGPRQANAPMAAWSLLDRRYIVEPDHSGGADAVPVLHTRNDFTDPGRLFFLSMGSDLPAGRYRVRFDVESGPGGYLIFSKITLGQFEKRDFFRERGIAHGEF